MPVTALPKSLEHLDAGWLTEALRDGGALPHGRVAGFELTPIGVGQGFAGELARLALTYEDAPAGAPASLVAKMPTLDPEPRMLFTTAGLYLTECAFYRDVAPLMTVPVPRCYFNFTDSAGSFVLLLEDMAPRRPGDQLESCTRERAEVAVRQLARIHAQFWDNEALAGIEWLRPLDHPERTAGLMAIYPFVWQAFKQRSGHLLPPRLRSIGDALPRSYARLAADIARPPQTLLHGDYRLDNMLFAPEGSGLALVDWQGVSAGRGAADLSYFLIGSLKPEDRRSWTTGLVEAYLDELHLLSPASYSFEDCERDIRIASLVHFAIYGILLAAADFEVDSPAVRLARVILERVGTYFEETGFDGLIDD